MATQSLTVEDANFLLDRLAADCAPMQEYRELLKNSVEGISRRILDGTTQTNNGKPYEGKIIFGIDHESLDEEGGDGVTRMRLCDTGCGMTGHEMVRYLNKLAAGGKERFLDKNFGLGAKIAAGARNPAGLQYTSLVPGAKVGHQVMFWKDPDTGYGLRQFQYDDGTYSHVHEVAYENLPQEIQDSGGGTEVVMFGSVPNENTWQPPGWKTNTLVKYLNGKFFRFPETISVQVPNEKIWDAKPGSSNMSRTVFGQKHYLDQLSTHSGTLEFDRFDIHWWLLGGDKAFSHAYTRGHVAILFQDELYALNTTKTMLYAFGVGDAASRVVLYIEPKSAVGYRVVPTASRSDIRINDEPAPWDEWAVSFMEKMPQAIDELRKSFHQNHDEQEEIARELNEMRHLFELQAYTPSGKKKGFKGRVDDTGSHDIITESLTTRKKGTGEHPGPGPSPSLSKTLRRNKGTPTDEQVQLGTPTRLAIPNARWVSLANHTRERDDEFEDRAAIYIPPADELVINEDFRLFETMIERLREKHNAQHLPPLDEVIRNEVKHSYQLVLMEAVIGVRGFQTSPKWNPDDLYDRALSPEALTAVVQSRYQIWHHLNRRIASKVGRMQKDILRAEVDAEAVAE
jgi:hypothetical protein